MNMAAIKSLVRIEDVVRRYHQAPQKREGHHLLVRCPFHDDKGRPNLVLFPDRNNYKCFTCGAQGDSIDFVSRILRLGRDGQAQAAQVLVRDFHLRDVPRSANRPPAAQPPRPVEELDLVYSALLSLLSLHPLHRAQLRARGLSDGGIVRNGYRSLPPWADRPTIVLRLEDLLKGHKPLSRIPGFAVGAASQAWTLYGAPGLLIPIRTPAGQVRGLQVRPDGEQARRAGKYHWISTPDSPEHHGGASSGAPCHVTGHPYLAKGDLWISEGPLKTDVLSDRLQVAGLAVPSVSSWREAPAIVHLLQPRRVVIAFDQDRNPNTRRLVARQALALRNALAGYDVNYATWDPSRAKGIDDAILAGTPLHV